MKKRKTCRPPLRRDVPATVGFVTEVRDELIAKFNGLEHKFEQLGHRFEESVQEHLAIAHRTQTLMGEQRSENRIILE